MEPDDLMAITGTRPTVVPGKERVLVGWYASGTVSVQRLKADGTTVLTFPASATGVVTTGADDAQFGIARMTAAGGALMAAVSKSGTVCTFLSTDDGATWSEV
jgi:6-phosphogluconolactonase (cycloisomerase 2 family)